MPDRAELADLEPGAIAAVAPRDADPRVSIILITWRTWLCAAQGKLCAVDWLGQGVPGNSLDEMTSKSALGGWMSAHTVHTVLPRCVTDGPRALILMVEVEMVVVCE